MVRFDTVFKPEIFNITSIGSDISGGGNVTLIADNQINLLAAQNTSSQHSTNSSSGASIGIAYNMGGTENGFSLELAASRANGKADGDTLSYSNSHVSAGSTVTLQSGGDTNIKGGVISANGVVASVGGDLNIQSLQDKAVYDSKQNSAGFSASICIPPFCYGASSASGSVSKASVNGDYLSVVEQSGIKAGDGGFQLVVHGNTDLVGGVISSSQAAIDQGKNSLATGSLTYTALQNKDVYEADSFAMSGTVSGKFGDQTTAKSAADQKAAAGKAAPSASGGIGHDSGSQSSTTASGISAGALTITDAARQAATGKTAEQALAGIATGVTTGTAASQAGALTQAWNGAALMKEVQAQTQITQAFSAQMPKAIAEYATKQELALQKELANKPNDPELLAELDNWVEGGTYRVALHTLSGALSGGVGGALGAMSVSSAAKSLNEIAGDRVTNVAASGYERSGGQRGGLRACPRRGAWYRYPRRGTSGAATALAVDTNNRQFHRAETHKLAVLKSGKSEAEEHRLDAAACAFVKCSDGVPTNDPQYAKLQALQKKGKAYTAELQLLKNTGEFIYSPWVDKAGSITSQDEAFRRVGGGINLLAGSAGVFGGAVLASGGAVSCPMSLGAGCGLAVVGVGVAGLSAQQASNGNAALWGP